MAKQENANYILFNYVLYTHITEQKTTKHQHIEKYKHVDVHIEFSIKVDKNKNTLYTTKVSKQYTL